MPIGGFFAHETILKCEKCNTKFPSKDLRKIVPDNCTYGYDVMEYVGRKLFIESYRDQDILQDLKKKNIEISLREIAFLGRKFIVYLAIAHQESRSRLKSSMMARGGYVMHLDGTCDGDSPCLFSGADGLSDIILGSLKIPSEKASSIVPFLEKLKDDYGKPLAIVHDMGSAIQLAVDQVFPDTPDFICHFHFLRDLGKDLLGKDYASIRSGLKNSRIRAALKRRAKTLRSKIEIDSKLYEEVVKSLESGTISEEIATSMPELVVFLLLEWILDADSMSDGYGFPFDRHHFVFFQRVLIAHRLVKSILGSHLIKGPLKDKIKSNSPLVQLHVLFNTYMRNKILQGAFRRMEEKTSVFDRVREALRITQRGGKNGLNDDGDDADANTIEKNLEQFTEWLSGPEFPFEQDDYRQMTDQIEKYWSKLFADPIEVQTPEGVVLIQPSRTNNSMERIFRDFKRNRCRKTGAVKMNQAIKAMLADTLLVRNLKNEEYLSIILSGHKDLAVRFAAIDVKLARKKLNEAKADNRKLPGRLLRIVKRKNLIEEIAQVFQKAS